MFDRHLTWTATNFDVSESNSRTTVKICVVGSGNPIGVPASVRGHGRLERWPRCENYRPSSEPPKNGAFTLTLCCSISYGSRQIIVHAPSHGTEALVESCANIHAMTKDIYSPKQGESIQIGQQTSSFSISISD